MLCFSIRSGSEIYERLPTDASQGDDINLSPSFNDRMLSPSDDSDIYSHVDMYSQENGDSLVKPSDIKNAKMHQGKIVFFTTLLTNVMFFFNNKKTCKLIVSQL